MRRSMVAMLVTLAALSTPLAAQSAEFGLAGTLGGSWQIEGVDIGYLRPVHAGPFQSVSASVRLGGFIDEGQIVGGSQGFVAGLVLAARTGMAHLADVGNENNAAPIGLDVTFEAIGYGGVNSPLPQGSSWAAVSILPGIRFGDGPGARYSIVLGPTVFLGKSTDVRAFVGLRFEIPLAHHTLHP